MQHTIQVQVENKFGVLARISSLFSARGYNINSLAVGETEDPSISRMTIVVNAADEMILEQIKKQLDKLIDVISVVDLAPDECIDRELILLKLNKTEESAQSVKALSKERAFNLLEEKDEYYLVEICEEHQNLTKIMDELKKLGIKELVRTGKVAISS